ALVPGDRRPALAAAVDGGGRLRLGVHPVAAIRAAVGLPAGGQDGRVHGHLQFLHRDPAAGRREPAGVPAQHLPRWRAGQRVGGGWHQPGDRGAVRAAGERAVGSDRRDRWGGRMKPSAVALVLLATLAAGCTHLGGAGAPAVDREYYGTTEPFAANAVYFVVTDRFVNGDPSNDQRAQGAPDPALRTFDRPTPGAERHGGNIGYLGGDFRGLLDNAGYIADMGFGAVWLTPIVDNPDQAFTGGDPIGSDAFFKDRGKTGYHGYWGVDFFT